MSLLANKQITKGWHYDSTSRKWVYGVYNSSGAVKKVFDEDGALYQEDTKLTLTAAQLNGTSTPLTSPVLTTPQINDTTADHQYVFAVNELTADRTVTLPLLTGNDEFTFNAHAQTLTNKTLTAPKIVTTGYIADADGDEYLKFVEATNPVTYVQITSGNTTVAPKVQGAGETNTDLHLLGTGTGNVYISDGTDPTKDITFELNGATTAKTMTIVSSQTADRSLTLPDATDTLVGKATTDTLTNKTLTAPVMTNPSSTFSIGTHDYGTGTDDWTLSAAELLKTVHKPTNAGGAVNAIIADTAGIPYIFINGTGQTLTVKGTGAGIAIADGKTHIVMSDGANVIALAAVSA